MFNFLLYCNSMNVHLYIFIKYLICFIYFPQILVKNLTEVHLFNFVCLFKKNNYFRLKQNQFLVINVGFLFFKSNYSIFLNLWKIIANINIEFFMCLKYLIVVLFFKVTLY